MERLRVAMKIDAIHLEQLQALLDTGVIVPITNLFDAEGDETDSPDDAISFVAGCDNLWVAGIVADYEAAQVN